ncbi:MAG TPA: hypothetical protein ACFYDZ_08360 [Candidatus Brocadiaceae bacterium]
MTVEFGDLQPDAKRLQVDVQAQLKKLQTVNQNYEEFKKNTETELNKLTSDIGVLLDGPLNSEDAWKKHQEKDDVIKAVRDDLHDKSETIKDSIEQVVNLMVTDTRIPKRLTIIGITILLLMIGGYIALHIYIDTPTYKKESGEKLFEAIGKLKAHILNTNLKLDNIPIIPQDFSDFNSLTAKAEPMKVKAEQNSIDPEKKEKSNKATGTATAQSQDALTSVFAERISCLNGFISVVKTGTITGTGSVYIVKNQVDKIREELEKIEKDVLAFSKNDGFFWIAGFWRWLEIVFWGEFGVMVGILAWVCTQAEAGKYTKGMYEREVPWYIAEIVMGPVIVVAVFFLLRQFIGTFMTGVAEEEVRSSIYLTLGISFALGLFIRRTLGVFNFIKEKLPLPKD